MNLSLDNPYGNVTIPRAKLRPYGDNSTVILNPMTLESAYNGTSSQNPYGSFKPQGGEQNSSGVPVYGEARDGNQPPPYNSQGTYTVKEDDEQVGRCYACCSRCRRKK
ncbi:hypothetical protein AMEX_G405 [Astyanax mexicanus]|uniref:Si:ch211-202f5.3 n=1 Tax=Astyanax mexicanus TaxID=7994 RepID=A0A8B9K2L6_ASTMX|nr:hypothetical protein AMEX_G405 [Astyanax mexicanus]